MSVIQCTRCRTPLGPDRFNLPAPVPCPKCGAPLKIAVFPALVRPEEASDLRLARVEGDEAGCFNHPDKKAVIPCSSCGRFLCALCDIELNGRHLCPSCLETGRRKKKIVNLENHRTLYDSVALSLAIVPMLFVWPTIITAPLVLIWIFKYWKAPTSIVGRTKVRFILSGILAVLQIVGWSLVLVQLVT